MMLGPLLSTDTIILRPNRGLCHGIAVSYVVTVLPPSLLLVTSKVDPELHNLPDLVIIAELGKFGCFESLDSLITLDRAFPGAVL
jgi:hypothetical protein